MRYMDLTIGLPLFAFMEEASGSEPERRKIQ
jgi:hypothetical protein